MSKDNLFFTLPQEDQARLFNEERSRLVDQQSGVVRGIIDSVFVGEKIEVKNKKGKSDNIEIKQALQEVLCNYDVMSLDEAVKENVVGTIKGALKKDGYISTGFDIKRGTLTKSLLKATLGVEVGTTYYQLSSEQITAEATNISTALGRTLYKYTQPQNDDQFEAFANRAGERLIQKVESRLNQQLDVEQDRDAAAIKIQTLARAVIAKKVVKTLAAEAAVAKKDGAATKIQGAFRKHVAENELKGLKAEAVAKAAAAEKARSQELGLMGAEDNLSSQVRNKAKAALAAATAAPPPPPPTGRPKPPPPPPAGPNPNAVKPPPPPPGRRPAVDPVAFVPPPPPQRAAAPAAAAAKRPAGMNDVFAQIKNRNVGATLNQEANSAVGNIDSKYGPNNPPPPPPRAAAPAAAAAKRPAGMNDVFAQIKNRNVGATLNQEANSAVGNIDSKYGPNNPPPPPPRAAAPAEAAPQRPPLNPNLLAQLKTGVTLNRAPAISSPLAYAAEDPRSAIVARGEKIRGGSDTSSDTSSDISSEDGHPPVIARPSAASARATPSRLTKQNLEALAESSVLNRFLAKNTTAPTTRSRSNSSRSGWSEER